MVSASASNAASVSSATTTITSTQIGTNASNKVDSVTALATTVPVGETMTITVDFTLGKIGNKNDAWFQPVASGDFDPSILRLISAQVTITADSVATLQTADALYLGNLSGNGVTGRVVYTFQGLKTGTTVPKPYQLAAGGNSRAFCQ